MNHIFEDKLGKLVLMIVFIYLCTGNAKLLAFSFVNRDTISFWPLILLSQFCIVAFMGFSLNLTVKRLPARESAAGIAPRIVAVGGTFIMMVVAMLPPEPIGPTQRVISTFFIIVGASLSIWCIKQLGRSFSLMATSRELKTKGSYSVIRHPLYGAEAVMMFGIALGHGSLLAFGICGIWFVLQIRRAQYEESILRKTFPEYEDYAQRVPMLIPALWRRPATDGQPGAL